MSNLVNLKQLNMQSFTSSPKYFYEFVKSIPILTKEEEYELFHDMNVKGCLDAAHKLIMHNLRYVNFITRKYDGYGMPYEDLVQEGIIGLMKSIKNFDTSRNVALLSYATHYIESAVKEYIVSNWNLVKITPSHDNKKLFYNLRKYVSDNRHPTNTEIKEASLKLGVKESEIMNFSQRLHHGELSIDETFNDDYTEENTKKMLIDNLSDELTLEETLIENEKETVIYAVQTSLNMLSKREMDIIKARYLDDNHKTLSELSHVYGISIERIRQIEKAAINKVKTSLLSNGVV